MARFPRSTGSRRARCLAAVLAVLALAAPAAGNAAAATRPHGIDVSEFQCSFAPPAPCDADWEAVGATNLAFAIVRATKGTAYLDPRYAFHRDGATAAGMVVGAYHRATPSTAPGDAVAEADFFVKRARNDAGDVVPALDIEETGGLTVSELTSWVRTWLTRVRNRLGVRPMIYTSPYFWRTNLGDTTWFAEHGYPLWIAHWDAVQPAKIAGDWGGQGWTFWQYRVDPAGTVPGIETAIDRDVFAGADLIDGTIASLAVSAASGGTIEGSRILCGGLDIRCSRLANPGDVVTLTATPDEGEVLQGWTGACAAAGTAPTCDVTVRGAVEVSAVFQPVVVLPQDGDGSAFSWATRSATFALGGSYRIERRAGASLAFDVAGSNLSIRLVRGPTMGRVRVWVDGILAGIVDGWDRERGIRRVDVQDLGPGPHRLVLVVSGTKREVSRGTDVGVDAIRWGGQLRDDPAASTVRWGRMADPSASDGLAVISGKPGATAALTFTGTGVTWLTANGPDLGRAEIWLDGSLIRVAGLYDPVRTWGVEETLEGLTDTEHVLQIVVTGTKNTASTGTGVVVDGWIVR